MARREFNEWLADIETRIANLRAQRKGEGISLTREQTRALAGEWYDWFIARHPFGDSEWWEQLRDDVREAMREAVGVAIWEANDPDDLWRREEDVRAAKAAPLVPIGISSDRELLGD